MNITIERETGKESTLPYDYSKFFMIKTIKEMLKCLSDGNGRNDRKTELSSQYALTIQEAAQYFHIGENKIRTIVENDPHGAYYFMNGNRVMIKRRKFEEYLDKATVI